MWSDLVPSSLLAWLDRRRAMRGLKDLQEVDRLMLTFDEGNLVNRAKVALELGDRDTALRHWNEALARYPAFARRSRDAPWILVGLKQFDEAEALMLAGMKRAPGNRLYFEGYAQVAEARGDTEVAIERWNRVRRKWPGFPNSHIQEARCLQTKGRLAEADALISQAIERFADNHIAWMLWARIAEDRRDWPEALRRWQATDDRFPGPGVDIGAARVLAELGRIEEAETRLHQGLAVRPLVAEMAIMLARLAGQRGDKDTELQRWTGVRRRFPKQPLGYREEVRMLSAMGRHDDADAVLQEAVKAFPDDGWPTIEHASLASMRKDWPAAETRWAAVRAKWPERADGYHRGAEALAALGRQDEAADLRAEQKKLSEA